MHEVGGHHRHDTFVPFRHHGRLGPHQRAHLLEFWLVGFVPFLGKIPDYLAPSLFLGRRLFEEPLFQIGQHRGSADIQPRTRLLHRIKFLTIYPKRQRVLLLFISVYYRLT
jgi:hypothetical protein